MRRKILLPSLFLAAAIALAPGLSFARAGFGSSFGSRGSMTYSAPPSTSTSPYGASPFQRSLTPQQAPSYARPYGSTFGGGYGYGGGRPFMSGLMGGLLGAGIGGLLFGGGFLHGISGFGGFLGFLLQIFLLVWVGRWLFRRFFSGQPAFAGGGGFGSMFARNTTAGPGGQPGFGGVAGGGARARPVAIQQADFLAFEQNLKLVQQAWSAHDLGTMRQLCTPEMVSYFAEQMAEQASRGVRNQVSNVQLQQGDLSEAWREGNRDYATVSMRYAMIDVTTDAAGRVVDGSPNERVTVTEFWTFLRSSGGRWILSAIQQAR